MKIRRTLTMVLGFPLLLFACNGEETVEEPEPQEAPQDEEEPADEEVLDELEELDEEEDEAAQGLSVEDGTRDTGEVTPRAPASGFPQDAVAVGETVTVDELDVSVVSAMHGEVAVDKWLETGPPAAEGPEEGNDYVLVLFEVGNFESDEGEGPLLHFGLVDADDNIYDNSPDPDNRYDACPGQNREIWIGPSGFGYECFQVPDEQVEAGDFTVFVETQVTQEDTGWLEVPEFDDQRVLTDDE